MAMVIERVSPVSLVSLERPKIKPRESLLERWQAQGVSVLNGLRYDPHVSPSSLIRQRAEITRALMTETYGDGQDFFRFNHDGRLFEVAALIEFSLREGAPYRVTLSDLELSQEEFLRRCLVQSRRFGLFAVRRECLASHKKGGKLFYTATEIADEVGISHQNAAALISGFSRKGFFSCYPTAVGEKAKDLSAAIPAIMVEPLMRLVEAQNSFVPWIEIELNEAEKVRFDRIYESLKNHFGPEKEDDFINGRWEDCRLKTLCYLRDQGKAAGREIAEGKRTPERMRSYLIARAIRWLVRDINEGLLVKVARQKRPWIVDDEDEFQRAKEEGRPGLMLAWDRFDPSRGYRFSTATVNLIKKALGKEEAPPRSIFLENYEINDRLWDRNLAFRPTENQALARIRREEKEKEHDRNQGLSPLQQQVLFLRDECGSSLEEVGDSYQGRTREWARLVEREGRIECLGQMMREYKDLEMVKRTLESLPPEEKQVWKLRFGLADGFYHSFGRVAEELKITKFELRRIEVSTYLRLITLLNGKKQALLSEIYWENNTGPGDIEEEEIYLAPQKVKC